MDKNSVKFIILFLATAIIIYVLLEFVPKSIYNEINHWNALAAGWLLKIAGVPVMIQGDILLHKNFTAKVVGECSAVFLGVLPFSFFLAYPADIPKKSAGIFIGLPFLFAFNLLRIAFVFIIGISYPKLFPWVHLYVGQVVMILIVIGICLTWLKWGNKIKVNDRPGIFIFKALTISILPFAAWVWLCQPYTMMILRITGSLLETAGYPVQLPQALEIYPHTFISFNIIVILSCLLASQFSENFTFRKVAMGGIILVAMHILFQMLPFLFFQHHIEQSRWMINSFLVINQFILPFIFWFILMPKQGDRQSATI